MGTAPSAPAPATCRAICFTAGAGNGKPRRLSSRIVQRASPGRAIAIGPAMRSGSRSASIPAKGPRASLGSTRVSSRACTANVPSNSSTRSESKPRRTVQSIPLPMREAISFGVSTTESGPPGRASSVSLLRPLVRARGVGAPTAVSATGGSAVRRGPSQRDAAWRMGSRYHQATAPSSSSTNSPIMRKNHLTKARTPSDLVHRAAPLERAHHQVHRFYHHRLGVLESSQGLRQAVERRGRPPPLPTGIPSRPAQREVGPKRPPLRREAQGRERLLHPVLQQFQGRLRSYPDPHHPRSPLVREHSKPPKHQGNAARCARLAPGGLGQRRLQLRLLLGRYLAEEFEGEVQ